MPEVFDASAHRHQPKSKPKASSTGGTSQSEFPHHHGRDVNEYSMVMREEEPTTNPFRAFQAKPRRVYFDTQHYEEQVLLLLRSHPITQLGWVVAAVVMSFLPLLFSSVGLFQFLPARFQLAINIGWYLLILGYVLESFLSWFYNVFIVTDERVVDVDFSNLLHRNISSAKIENIEDITAKTSGFWSTIFNYGTVVVQTAETVTEFEFANVPQPEKVTAFLNEMIVEEEREKLEGRVN